MAIRFTSGNGNGVPSGYEGSVEGLEIPACGLEDVDRALFNLFQNEIKLEVQLDSSKKQTVPTIFAAGERWSMLKNGRAIRDENGTLILPLITIRRTGIEQDTGSDIGGRGINQHTGEFNVCRKLDYRDRAYQNLINKLGIENQNNIAVNSSSDNTQIITGRTIGENSKDLDIAQGGLLAPKLNKSNVWQIITLPSPQFYTALYEITIWAQYAKHMNEMIEKIMSSFLPTAHRTMRLDTPKGYWFMANFESSFSPEDNADSYTSEELVRKCKINVKVPAYIVSSDASGLPRGGRVHISSPIVSFSIGDESLDTNLVNGMPGKVDPYENADDPDLFILNVQNGNDKRNQVPNRIISSRTVNPFTNKTEESYSRIINRDTKSGETVMMPDTSIKIKIS